MSSTEEATINPDGSTAFGSSGDEAAAGGGGDSTEGFFEQTAADTGKETDPALFLALAFLLLVAVWFFVHKKGKGREDESAAFFSEMDGEKFNLKLPVAVDEYYEVKSKCEQSGWVPGQPPANAAAGATGPHRVLAQALMKRCIADIPIVTHIQKESAGMNKLYSQSMCSVKQWKAYQSAESMVSAEVDEVRAEADEIEAGWSQVIWRQAMQYHSMLEKRHETESKALAEQVEKKKAEEVAKAAKQTEMSLEEVKKAKEIAAERAAEELLKAEEREKQGKSSFNNNNGGMKKGFLSNKKK